MYLICFSFYLFIDELTNIFWNLYQYYKQFKNVIEHHINEMSVTVEKKLKDFVKIARWNEISYWSVKENVDRNYRTLHKYIKEYEVIIFIIFFFNFTLK